jgi:hypothetical protein
MHPQNHSRTKHLVSGGSKAGWRVNEWARDAGLGRSSVYNLLAAGAITSVKVGKARVITTAPADFLAALRERAA